MDRKEAIDSLFDSLGQQESIKLTRGQRGSYGWEIKVLSNDVDASGFRMRQSARVSVTAGGTTTTRMV